jgi:hypothetical protein
VSAFKPGSHILAERMRWWARHMRHDKNPQAGDGFDEAAKRLDELDREVQRLTDLVVELQRPSTEGEPR